MEVKKSYAADLERHRARRFLLGLVVAASLLLVALEYTSNPYADDYDESLLDDLAQDMELLPVPMQNDLELAPPAAEEPKPAVRVNVVDDEPLRQQPERLVAEQPALTNGDGEPTTEEADAPAVAPVAVDDNDRVLNLRVVERLPEFPGGYVEMMRWLTKNLKYPPRAKALKAEGKVVVSFVINADGTTCDPKIVQSVNAHLDSEALRVVRIMPLWKPGEDHGKPCRTLFVLPIVFKL